MNNRFSGALGATLLLSPVIAHAQSSSDNTDDSSSEAPEIVAEVVVTALRKETALQDTPISISVLSSDALDELDASSLQDIFRLLPNMNISAALAGLPRLSVRGIQVAGEPTVGLYYDETFLSGGSGTSQDSGSLTADLNLFDVERLELLRGPQGTLYGASAMTGALKVIFKKPNSRRFEAALDTGYQTAEDGSDGWRMRGMINVPIMDDRLALRAVASRQVTPGYIDAAALGRKDTNSFTATSLRTLLRWTPTADIDIDASFIYQRQTTDNTQGWDIALGPYKSNSTTLAPFESALRLHSLSANWDVGPVRITATGSHYDWDVTRSTNLSNVARVITSNPNACRGFFGITGPCSTQQLADFANAGLAVLPVILVAPDRIQTKSAELRVASDQDGRLAWTAGAFYQDRFDRVDSNFARGSAGTGLPIEPLTNLAQRFIGTKLVQKAAFLELSYGATEQLTLTGGARRYDYDKSTEGAVLLPNRLVGVVPSPYSKQEANAQGWLSKFGIDYKVDPDMLLYASAGQGFRPGGANNVPGLGASLIAYEPDELWTYEIGAKTNWFNDRLSSNIALFHIDWDNLQVNAMAASGPFTFITNAGAARVRGGEIEIVSRPLIGVEINLGVGYADGKLTQDQINSDIVVTGSLGRAGDRLPNSPRLTLNVGAEYRWEPVAGLDAYFRGDALYRSHMNSAFRPNTDPFFHRFGDDWTMNVRGGVELDDITVSVSIENLTNRRALTALNSSVLAIGEAYSIPPRTYGVTLGMRF